MRPLLLASLLACADPAAGPAAGGGADGGAGGPDDTAAAGDSGAGVETGDAGTPTGQVLLTEVMAANRDTLVLDGGEHPDWVELFNPGPDPVSLAGWTLTDAPEQVAPPSLPAVTLAPGGFLVVYATGEVGTAPDGRATLPFRLAAEGEQLLLRDATGAVADAVAWGPQVEDVSWGRPQAVTEAVLVTDGQAGRVAPGAPAGWSEPGLDTSGWAAATLPLGRDARVGDGENLALFAAAEQSSAWSSAYPASHGVDGEGSTFTHTATGDHAPWWSVDLGQEGTVTAVRLGNRLGCCPERLYNVTVSILDAAGAEVWASDVLNPVEPGARPPDPGATLDAGLSEPVVGQTVRVDKAAVGGTTEHEWLSLGEVEVWGQWAPPYGAWIETDVTPQLEEGGGELVFRAAFAPRAAPPTRLSLELWADDAVALAVDGAVLVEDNLAERADRDVSQPARFDLDPSWALGGGLLAARLVDVGGDDALLRLRLVAADIDTDRAPGAERYFDAPTPGAPNGAGFRGFVEAPVADPPRGWIDGPTTVELTAPMDDSALLYTLDGSVPTAERGTWVPSGSVRLDLDGTTLLRAVAVRDGWADSPVVTHTWLDLDDVLAQPALPDGLPATWDAAAQSPTAGDYEMDPDVVDDPATAADLAAGLRAVPALSLVLPHDDLWDADAGIYINSTERGAAWERATSMELLHPDGTSFQGDCGLRIHGYGWRPHSNTKKHSFRLEFRREYGASRLEHPMFPDAPVDHFDSVVLRAQGSRGWQDFRDPEQALYVRDAFARDSARAMGKADGHAAYVHLFLNGLYWGLYMAVERPDADFGARYFGGDDDEYDAINRRTNTNEAIDGDLDAYHRLLALSDADLTEPDAYAAVADLVEIDDLIDYMLLHQYTANRDGPELFSHNNMRGLRRRVEGEGFRFFVWDMEYSLWYADDHINIDVDVPGSASHVYARLRDNADFRARYAERAALHLGPGGALSADESLARFDARLDEIEDAAVAESARWGDTDRAVPYTRDVEWAEERRRLTEEFFPRRTEVLIEQLTAAGLY